MPEFHYAGRVLAPRRGRTPITTGTGDRAYSTAVDSAGNTYVTGYFYEEVHFPSRTVTRTMTSSGDADGFLAKYTSDGTCDWVKRFGSAGWDGGYSVTVDVSDRVCLTGWYTGAVDFNSGGSPRNLTSRVTESGWCDIFVAQYEGNGTCRWARGMDGDNVSGGSDGVDVATDASGNVYLTGFFTGRIFDPSGNVSSTGAEDILIAKYNADGDRQWMKGIGGIDAGGRGTDHGRSIAVDGNGNVYVAGSFRGNANFGTSASPQWLSSLDADAFIAKYDGTGAHKWSKRMGGPADDGCEQLAVSRSAGVIFATGWFKGVADFAPVEDPSRRVTATGDYYDVFLAAYCTEDQKGKNHFAIGIGGEGLDEGYGLGTDGRGNAYVTGGFGAMVDFDPDSIGVSPLTATTAYSTSIDPWDPAHQDAFLASYCSGGHFRWAMRLGGHRADFGRAVSISPDGRRLDFAGYYGPVGATVSVTPTDARFFRATGDSDGFLMRLTAPASP